MVLKAWKNLKPGEVLASEALFVGGILRRTSSQHRAPGGEADCLVQASLLLYGHSSVGLGSHSTT